MTGRSPGSSRTSSEKNFRIVHLSIQRTHVHLLVEANSKGNSRRGMQGFQISAAKHLNAAFTEDVGVRALCREHQRAPNPLRPPRMPVMAGAAIPRKRRKSARRHQRPGRVCCTSEPMPPSAASTGPTRWCRSHKGSRARSRYALAIARAARRRDALRRTATASRPRPGDAPRAAARRQPARLTTIRIVPLAQMANRLAARPRRAHPR